MDVEIGEEPFAALGEYGAVRIAFEVRSVLEAELRDGGLGGCVLRQRTLETPYLKDHDAIDGEGPSHWAQRFDLSNWGLLVARLHGRCIGGSVVAFQTAGITVLEGRSDLAVLWDIRVSPEFRGQGIGSTLFRATEAWATAKGCRWLKVETQNTNVGACRFYARQGCELGAIHRLAYPELPGEIQLLWYRRLSPPGE